MFNGNERAAMTALCAAVTALALTGCGSQVGVADHGQPPKLHISTGFGAAAGEAVPALAPAAGRLGLFGGYVLAADLPTSPTHAAVWRWPTGQDGAASRDAVSHLGALLGLAGTPQRHAHGWLLASATGELRVRDGGSLAWSYVRGQTDCPPYQVDIDDAAAGGVGCATASAVASAVAPAPSTGSAVAKPVAPTPTEAPVASDAAARALLAGLGVSGAEHSETDLGSAVLTVDPTIGSLPTQGVATTVTVDAHGVSAANGHLGVPKAGAQYPLRSAKDAFGQLGVGPRPMIAQYCGPVPAPMGAPDVSPSGRPAPPSEPPVPTQCPSPQPIRVTGATLGLLATWEGGSDGPNVLVPAWFFTVEDSPYPLSVVAVDPAFVASGSTPNAGEGSGATSGGSSGSGGVVKPAPVSVAPAPPVSQTQSSPSS